MLFTVFRLFNVALCLQAEANRADRIRRYALELRKRITPEQEQEWIKGTPTEWANEGNDVIANVVYKDIHANGEVSGNHHVTGNTGERLKAFSLFGPRLSHLPRVS